MNTHSRIDKLEHLSVATRQDIRRASCALTLDGRVTWCGEGGYLLQDAEDGTCVGTVFKTRWHADDQAAIDRSLAIARERGRSRFEARHVSDGAWFEVTVTLRKDESGEPLELLVRLYDSPADRALMEDYRLLFDALPVGMWVTHDAETKFLLGNPASERRVGFPPGSNQSLTPPEGQEHDIYRCYRDDAEVEAEKLPAQRAAKGEQVRNEEYEVRLQNGQSYHVILNASPMRNMRDEIVGSVTVEIDITERKRYEKAQTLLLECSGATGQAFFDLLVKAIGDTLKVGHVYLSEIVGDRRQTLHVRSAYIAGQHGTCEDYTPRDTPCHEVMNGASKFVASGLKQLYPNAEFIHRFGLESFIGRPLRSSDGEIIGIIDVLHEQPLDETQRPFEIVEIFAGRAAAELQRMRSEASLRESEEKSRIITDATPSLVSFIDRDERYQFANAAFKRWFGRDPDAFVGKAVADVTSADDYEKIHPHIHRALKGERVSYETYLVEPGRHVRAEYVPQVADDGTVLGIFGFVSDMSDRKAHEEALGRSEAQFRTLFQHLPVGVAMVDRTGRVLLENEVFTRLLPKASGAAAETVGTGIFDRTCSYHTSQDAPLPPIAHPVKQALRGVVVRDVELLCRYADKDETWVLMSAIPILNDTGRPSEVLVVVADVDRAKRDEAQRTLLVNELNHRVKNTLASVQSIAAQTFRSSTLTKDGLLAFEERLLALSNTHNLLTLEHWGGADLQRVVGLVLEPHDPGGDRLRTTGPGVRLKPPAALAFAMALHELATNAVKYGALSVPNGTVVLSWEVITDDTGSKRLQLKWMERGGPPVTLPVRKGFGTRLIERSLAFELGSETSIRFEPRGVICEIDAELQEISG